MSNREPQIETQDLVGCPREREASGVFPFLMDPFPFCMLPSSSSKDNQGANREAGTEGLGAPRWDRLLEVAFVTK